MSLVPSMQALLVVVLLTASATTTTPIQSPGQETFVFQTREEIGAIVRGMAKADDLLVLALDRWLRVHDEPRTLGVLSAQYPGQLEHPTLDFVSLDEPAVKSHVAACGIFMFVHANRVAQDRLRVTVTERGKCGARSQDYEFIEGPDSWKAVPQGPGNDTADMTDCSCP